MKRYQAFLQWLPKQNPRIHAIVRVYEVPLGGFVDWCDDGEPDQDWVWLCNAQIEPHLVFIRGARSKPVFGTLRALLRLSRTFSPNIDWERRKRGKLVRRSFKLPCNSAGENERNKMAELYHLAFDAKIQKLVAGTNVLAHEIEIKAKTYGLTLDEAVATQLDALSGLTGNIKLDSPQTGAKDE